MRDEGNVGRYESMSLGSEVAEEGDVGEAGDHGGENLGNASSRDVIRKN